MTHARYEIRNALLGALERGPGDIYDLATRTGVAVSKVAHGIATIRRNHPGEVYVLSWAPVQPRSGTQSNWRAVYALGSQCSKEEAAKRDAPRPTPAERKVIKFLEANPWSSTKQVSEGTGMNVKTLQTLIKRLRESTPKKVYLAAWADDNKTAMIPLWCAGGKRDEPAPKRSPQARQAKYRKASRALIIARDHRTPATWMTGL